MKRSMALMTVLFLICIPLGSYLTNADRETGSLVRTSDPASENDSHTARSDTSRDQVWDIQTLAYGVGTGNISSLALDSNNQPHIASFRGYNDSIGYAMGYYHYDGNQWNERYYNLSSLGYYGDIAMDSDDHPHFCVSNTHYLKYVYFDGSHWDSATVDSTLYSWESSIAIDSVDEPHIGYIDSYNYLKYAQKNHNGTWQSITVDSSEPLWNCVSMDLDSNDNPHFIYCDYNWTMLKYAYYDGQSWQSEDICSLKYSSWDTLLHSLVLDAADHPHIAYFDRDDYAVKYAYHDGSKWTFETVEVLLSDYSGEASLALDANGHPHVTYYDYTNKSCRYDYRKGGQWHTETVGNHTHTKGPAPLAIDDYGRAHISFSDQRYYLRYAVSQGKLLRARAGPDQRVIKGMTVNFDGSGSSPEEEIVDYAWSFSYDGSTKHLSGIRPTFRFDLAGNYTVTLTVTDVNGNTTQDEVFIRVLESSNIVADAGSGRMIEVGMTVNFEGYRSTGEVDIVNYSWSLTDGEPVTLYGRSVSYTFDNAGTFEVTLNVSDIAGFWDTDIVEIIVQDTGMWYKYTIEQSYYGGNYSSLATDSKNRPHIAYYDRYDDELIYLHFDGTIWKKETVKEVDEYYTYVSIEIDSNDHPHISYIDDYELWYAYFDGEEWNTEIVNDNGRVYRYTSLALDPDDRPHIFYYDYNDELGYAYYDGTEWNDEYIYEYDGGYISADLDSNGVPHVCFSNVGWGFNGTSHIIYGYFEEGVWNFESFELNPQNYYYYGPQYSLELDSEDRPHISYFDGKTDLIYMIRDGGNWIEETIDSVGQSGGYPSIDLDDRGRPHVSYHDARNRFFKYAYREGENWMTEIFDFKESYPGMTDIALDTNNSPHIIYFDNWNSSLKYAYKEMEKLVAAAGPDQAVTEGMLVVFDGKKSIPAKNIVNYTWSFSYDGKEIELYGTSPEFRFNRKGTYVVTLVVTSAEGNTAKDTLTVTAKDRRSWHYTMIDGKNTGNGTSVAIDSDNRPHIAYQGIDGIKIARYDGDHWHNESIVPQKGDHHSNSLALDSKDRAHIGYYDNAYEELRYLYYDGSKWQSEAVDSGGDVGRYSDIALDRNDRPHISYYDSENTNLKYAHFNGSEWQITTIDQPEGEAGDMNVGMYSSIALDSEGRPYISYYNWTSTDLKCAHFDGDGWKIETVDSQGDVGKYTSIAIDSKDNPHIGYYDEISWNRGNIKYAYYDNNAWHTKVINSAVCYDDGISLALDSLDVPHIVYYDGEDNKLEYAIGHGDDHVDITVDSYLGEGSVSLALDSFDRPHIGYYCNWDLKYASREIRSFRADAGANMTVAKGVLVQLDASHSTPFEQITDFEWTLLYDGKDRVLSGPSPTFQFDIIGAYLVVLTVTDFRGVTDTDTTIIEVLESSNPVADAGGDKEVYLDEVVTLNGSLSHGEAEIVNYTWSITHAGKMYQLFGMAVTFRFTSIGVFNVTLGITDALGATASDVVIITVKPGTGGDSHNVTLGPIFDENNNTIEGVPVTLYYNGTPYTAETDADGVAHFNGFPLLAIPPGTKIIAIIDGNAVEWEYGDPLVYSEEEEEKEGSDGNYFLLVIIAMVFVTLIIGFVLIWHKRRTRNKSSDQLDEEPMEETDKTGRV